MVGAGGGVVADHGEPVEHPGRQQRGPGVPGRRRPGEHPDRRVVPEHRAQRPVGQHQLVGAPAAALGVGQGERAPRRVRGRLAGLGEQPEHEPGEPGDVEPGLGVVDRPGHRLAQLGLLEQGGRVRAAGPEGLEQRVRRRRVDEAHPGQGVAAEHVGEPGVRQQRPARARHEAPVGQGHRERRELLPGAPDGGRRGEGRVQGVPPRRRAAQPGELLDERRRAEPGDPERREGGGVAGPPDDGAGQVGHRPGQGREQRVGGVGAGVEDDGAGRGEVGTVRGGQPGGVAQRLGHRVAQDGVHLRGGQRRGGDEPEAPLGREGRDERGVGRRGGPQHVGGHGPGAHPAAVGVERDGDDEPRGQRRRLLGRRRRVQDVGAGRLRAPPGP